jgi:hypothetical protein
VRGRILFVMVNMLKDIVIPFFEEQGVSLLRSLTDGDSAFHGNRKPYK